MDLQGSKGSLRNRQHGLYPKVPRIKYGNGTALEPTQKEDAPASPATGENSALPLWLALAVVSGGILLSLRKKVTC